MKRITLNYSLWYHQNSFYKVEDGVATLINHFEVEALYAELKAKMVGGIHG